MNQKEKQLEEISKKVIENKGSKQPPIFEMFVTLISLALAIMFFLFPDALSQKVGSGNYSYTMLLFIMPQWLWAFVFFIVGIVKSIGMLVDSKYCRIGGLVISAIAYSLFAANYSISFPSVGSVVFSAITLFCLISIPEVKRTGLNE